MTEWVTNAFKYAYPDRRGEVRVRLKRLPTGGCELVVEDDGVGRSDDAAAKGTGLGTRIVKAMALTMGAEIQYLARQPGTAARLIFPLQAGLDSRTWLARAAQSVIHSSSPRVDCGGDRHALASG